MGPGSIERERDPFVFPTYFHKMQILNKLFIVWGGAKGQGRRRGLSEERPPAPLSLTWVLCSPF